jgi:ABC-2 type transport system ATP-binding protein
MANDTVPRLEIRDLRKRYGSSPWALDGVTVSFGVGLTGLLGPNGAGKSTLMRCVAGIENWDRGTVRTGGVGYMPETVAFPAELRIRSYLRWVCSAKGIGRRRWRAEVDDKLHATGLVEAGDRIIATLSKGYRQRLGLAQAMIGDPPILLLDEPVSSLDPISLIDVRRSIRRLARSACVVVSTHQLAEARALCERVVLLDGGRVAFDGPMAEMGHHGGRPGPGDATAAHTADALEEAFAHAVGLGPGRDGSS